MERFHATGNDLAQKQNMYLYVFSWSLIIDSIEIDFESNGENVGQRTYMRTFPFCHFFIFILWECVSVQQIRQLMRNFIFQIERTLQM